MSWNPRIGVRISPEQMRQLCSLHWEEINTKIMKGFFPCLGRENNKLGSISPKNQSTEFA